MTNLEASYLTLGISRAASPEEIKQAYRTLARQSHPDLNPGKRGAGERLRQLNAAYETLREYHHRRTKFPRIRNCQPMPKAVADDRTEAYGGFTMS